MKPENKGMKDLLLKNGIPVKSVKYITSGSMKGTWYVYGPCEFTKSIMKKLTFMGFRDHDNEPLSQYSGNGGRLSLNLVGRSRYEFIG